MSDATRDHLKVRAVAVLKQYLVFNLSQTKGLPPQYYQFEPIELPTELQQDEATEKLIHSTGAELHYQNGNTASYNHVDDCITLPNRDQFKSTEGWAETALHELAHWTGHKSRLHRKLGNPIGTKDYAKEELIAELASAFLCAQLGFEKQISNQAAYLQSWIKALKGDSRLIFTMSRQAEKAAAFINASSKTQSL